ncbi:MAG TPA: phosphoribosyl-AMP cyclohydrolase [Candidatus Saccharimonadales bacterium]|nr:phosphoribosyl-AMP cyclohydrolase [Candidatus Saccharimonadales bacterium]
MKQKIDFTKNNGLVPVIIQDYKTGHIYMLGYMNEVALKKTIKTNWVYFWSRSRKKLWMKGEESGNKLQVEEILTDCDTDSLLVKVSLQGTNVCHTGNKSCFFTDLEGKL